MEVNGKGIEDITEGERRLTRGYHWRRTEQGYRKMVIGFRHEHDITIKRCQVTNTIAILSNNSNCHVCVTGRHCNQTPISSAYFISDNLVLDQQVVCEIV